MQRYYKRSREECFDADGWFHTGDLVRTDADGFVYFIGRRGAMIKTAGANVAPAEVEKAIAKVDRRDGGARRSDCPIPSADSWSPRSSRWRTAPSSTRPRCASGSRTSCRRTRFPKRFAAVPRSEIPAAVQRQGRPAAPDRRCSMPDTIDGLVRVARRTARRQADGHRHRTAGSATPSSTPPPATWPPRSSPQESARAPGSG